MGHVSATFTQAGFRWRNDDGNEANATYAAALNTSISLETATVTRCRIVLEETAGGSENNVSTQWQYQRNSGGWNDVTTSSLVVRAATSTQGSLDGTATTQQISSGTFVSAEVTEDGLSDSVRPSFNGNEATELELVFQLVDADVADTDTVELRVVRDDLTLFSTYSQTPSLTVDKAGAVVSLSGSGSVAADGSVALAVTRSLSGSGANAADGSAVLSVSGGGGGFPLVESRTTSNEGSNVTTHTVSLPANPTVGNLLVGMLAIGVDADTEGFDTLPSGWTELTTVEDTVDGGQVMAVIYREVDGTEGSTTSFTTTEACLSAHAVYEISGPEDPSTQAPEASSPASSDGGDPDPASLTPTGGAKDFLWLAFHDSQGSSTTAAPTDYTDLTTAHGGGTGGSAVELGVAERDLNASSEDPGTFTVDNTSRTWVALTVAIHPAATGAIDLTGSGANAAAGIGTLVATFALAGVGANAAAGTGHVTVTRGLSGTGANVATGSGVLSTGAEVALSGSGANASAGTGTLDVQLDLTGSGANASIGFGSLDPTRGLQGSGADASDGTGALDLTVDLSGAGAAASTGTGDLTVSAQNAVTLTGSGASASAGSGTADVIRGLVGTGANAAAAQAALDLTVDLAGAGAAATAGFGQLTVLRALAGRGANATAGVGVLDIEGPPSGRIRTEGSGLFVTGTEGSGVLTGSTEGSKTSSGFLEGSKV